MMANRREFLKKLGLGALGMGALVSGKENEKSEETFRVVHLTDMHVTSRRQGDKGYRKCIDSINTLDPAPDLVLMGGDMVFDGLYTELDEYKNTIQLYKDITSKLNMPYHHCLGNHDVLGLSPRRKVPVDFPGLGRKMIMEEVGMEDDYYSFNHKGWHFVILNSIHEIETEDGPGYEPRISEEQLDWLRYDLGDHQGMPTIAVSHYAVFNHTGQIKNDFDMKAMNYLILQNNRDLRLILERHKVKALLQGHTHTSEDFSLNDVWYISTQAASAAWWGGNWLGFKPGYNVLELGENEIVDWYPVTYNWKHQLEPEDTLERERIQERKEFNARQDSLYQAELKG
jgi:3',5'-cyclic AMP phosphodiesterase CpdA